MFGRGKEPAIQVDEGRLVVTPGDDGSAIDRRAFGEFVGPRGELASYALGWTSGIEPREGRLSIGIGRGNPGGGTFHMVVFPHDDRHGYALVDAPFESVPQGGPDLDASAARAHVDLPFIWAVVDTVMERDRRATWMIHWLLSTSAIVTGEVAQRLEPVLLLAHDDDGVWQGIGSTDADPATGRVEHLHHLVDDDPTLLDVIDLRVNERATRGHVGGDWARSLRS